MDLGFLGYGKMGSPLCRRLLLSRKTLAVYDPQVSFPEQEELFTAASVEDLVAHVSLPRRILLSIPAEAVDGVVTQLYSLLSSGDIVADFGNCWYKNSQRRASLLQEREISFLDVGISGGVSGARNGACLMIGGEERAYRAFEDIFRILACVNGYRYVGKSGAGHLAKVYHNALEYVFMGAVAELVESLEQRNELEISVSELFTLWNHGSIVESRLLCDASTALLLDRSSISGSVVGRTQEEILLLVEENVQRGLELSLCASALRERLASLLSPSERGKILNALRFVFGGHAEWKK